jgi:hypothetical protein
MNKLVSAFVFAAASMVSAAAIGQTMKMQCSLNGIATPEPVGDKQGHSIVVNNFTCRTEGGPLGNGVATGSQIYEYDGTAGVGKAGQGITRAPGGYAVWVNEEMRSDLQMTDGKVVGAKGGGRGKFTLATGSASALNGKPYEYTFMVTGPNQFTITTEIK